MADVARLPDVAMAAVRSRDGLAQGLPRIGMSARIGPDRVIAIGPDEWLAVADDGDAAALCARLAVFGLVVDVSGNRVAFRVSGPDARWLLAGGCSLDLDALDEGAAVSTLLARAQVVLVVERTTDLLVLPRRSFAAYLDAWFATAAC